MARSIDTLLGILNGAIGDYLARTGNGLALAMELVHDGALLPIERSSIAGAHPSPTGRVVVLVHGLMCNEASWSLDDGSDYGSLLHRDLGYTPFYVRYNSGRAIPESGAALERLLASLVEAYPVAIDELLLVGFSMGGLVIRSACHVAAQASETSSWLPHVRRAIYVGTPHLGAPLERIGRALVQALRAIDDPYARLAAVVGDLRSDGIKDLGDADLRQEDRARRRADLWLRDPRHPVPLLPEIEHYLVAGSLACDPRLAALFGDGLVPVPSGTDGACRDRATMALPPSHVRFLTGVGHLRLARHPEVYAQIRAWCEVPYGERGVGEAASAVREVE
ncbi:MAG: alpha/beta fold hydrolase [Deltaproteobacteria bacterium]|nr:alpha/beta fold hydrolase [Deltaproteobacteria bacterium]